MATGAEGTLAARPLAHLLIYALDNELNGSLELTAADGTEAGVVMMARGCPAKIRAQAVAIYLGDVLAELGIVPAHVLPPTLEQASAQGVPHGQILLAGGLVTQEQLVRGLREQALRKLSYLFSLAPQTAFAFHDGIDLLPDFGAADLVLTDPFPAIWTSIRDRPPEEHVRSLLARAGGAAFRLVKGERTDRFRFGREERALVDTMKVSDLTIADLIGLRVLAERGVKLFIYCLLVTKQIEVAAARAAQPAATPSAPSPSPSPPNAVAPRAPAVTAPTPQPQSGTAPAKASVSSPPAARPASAPRPEELSQREKAIIERAKTIKNEDYFQRLSVARDALPAQVDEAFAAVSRLWDASSLPSMVREPGMVVQAGLVEAHETLRDPAKRDIYMKKLLLGLAHVPDPAEDLRQSGAETELEGARSCLDRGDLDRAERLAKRAHKAKPDSAIALALLAWIEAQQPHNQSVDQTRQRILKLDRALRLDPELEQGLYFRAMLHMRNENYLSAQRDLAALIELNPENRDAQRELRECEELAKDRPAKGRGARAKPASGAAGFFGRLLKK